MTIFLIIYGIVAVIVFLAMWGLAGIKNLLDFLKLVLVGVLWPIFIVVAMFTKWQ